jgi:hypothetical protein
LPYLPPRAGQSEVHVEELEVRERIWSDVRDDADERTVIVQKEIERQ